MAFSISVDFSGAIAHLDNLQHKQVPFAAATALNNLAAEVVAAEKDEMQSVFDAPTNWTLNSIFIRKYARKDDLAVVVDFKDGTKGRSAGKYLAAQIHGGGRRTKAVESFFIGKGLMPAGYHIVPAAGARLNRHGNITLAAYRAMVKGVADGTHFALHRQRGKLQAGLYKRSRKGKVRAVLIYVSDAEYQKRLQYFEVAERVVSEKQTSIFDAALQHALATAR